MAEQIKVSLLDASVKSPTRPSTWTPTSELSSHSNDDTISRSKKRKRDGNTLDDLLNETFVVKPYPPTAPVKPRSLQPLLLLPRSQLPLSYLDITSSTKALPPSRSFESHIKILELEDRMGNQPTVLIARLDDSRTLFAVERESRGLYVLCQLGSWINLHDLRSAAVASTNGNKSNSRAPLFPQETIPAPQITSQSSKYSKNKRLAIEALQSMVKRPSTSLATDSHPLETRQGTPAFSQPKEPGGDQPIPLPAHAHAPAPAIDENAAPTTAAEISEALRTQYLEALYLSKASLAYFTKGPLSRARAAFHLDMDSTLDLSTHIAFLESLVMSSTVLDKKYRDGIPNCISLIDVEDHSGEEPDPTNPKRKKRKTSKKMKPGKNGLYPTEDTLIRRWWASHNDEIDIGGPGNSREDITKARVSQLRIRETQLQLIIILEVLALQPLVSTAPDHGEELPTVLPTVEVAKEKASKHKKPDHLTMLIDVHLDRLCIWQSLALETTASPMEELQNASMTLTTTVGQVKFTDNILRDFCVDIIVPFFSSRLPDRCASINRKLGGPVALSPPKPKLVKSTSFSGTISRPGAATKRPVPVKPRKSLQRVLSDDRERRSMSRGPNKAIALMRSATMPLMSNVKREASEAPSLSGIPPANAHPFGAGWTALDPKRFSSREVDLSKLAPNGKAKAQKQALVEAELKEAILALKKPNRELAGRAMAETAERRSTSASHPRKSKKPVRNPLFQGVQISATPRANRRHNVAAEPHHLDAFRSTSSTETSVVPASSLPIPQPTFRPARENMPTSNPLFSSIQATPTRKSLPPHSPQAAGSLGRGEINYGGFPPSSPLQARRSSAQLFNVVPESATKQSKPNSQAYGVQETPIRKSNAYAMPMQGPKGVQETPLKKLLGSRLDHGHPDLSGHGSDKENKIKSPGARASRMGMKTDGEESIYKSLGWDDDLDDLA